MGSGVPLIAAYIGLVIIGNLAAWWIGVVVERSWPALSLPIFLAMFFSVLVLAWPIAMRATARWATSA